MESGKTTKDVHNQFVHHDSGRHTSNGSRSDQRKIVPLQILSFNGHITGSNCFNDIL
jgi:hypothetical protein